MANNEKEEFWLSGKGLILLLLAVIVIWLLYGWGAYHFPPSSEKSGQYGDMFGGVTALFSGLAFAGLIFTLFVQKKELQYQRQELGHLVEEQRQTKGHLKDQAAHLKSQSEFIEKQIFENSFFQLLGSFNDYISNTEVRYGEKSFRGGDAFEHLLARFSTRVSGGIYGTIPDGSVNFLRSYEEFYKEHIDDLGPYFRQLYTILKFVANSAVSDKKFYSNILRAQMSNSELSLLACNIASPYGTHKMTPLVKDFDLLKHCENDWLLVHKGWDDQLRKTFEDWEFFKKLG